MTTYVEAREAIVTALQTGLNTSYPNLEIFWENRGEVDTNDVGEQYAKVDIDFLDSRQITIELEPETRVFGEVVLTLFVKEGTGTIVTLGWSDFINELMSNKRFGGVQTFTAAPGSKRSSKGWRSSEMIIPFTFDSIG